MAHPIYSRQQLLNRGLVKVKKLAADLGVVPTGDKRLIQSWADAIVEHQAARVQKVELQKATIEFNDGLDDCDLAGYSIIVNNEVVRDGFRTYLQAESWTAKRYDLIDPQQAAQQELEADIEIQSATIEAEGIEFIDITFSYYEAIAFGKVVTTICQDFDNGEWVVDDARFNSYMDAENYVKAEYMNLVRLHRGSGRIGGDDDERGSGRVESVIESINMTIEDTHHQDECGSQYSVRVRGVLAGVIWLSDDNGWTLDGEHFESDWRPVAKELALLTRRDLVAA